MSCAIAGSAWRRPPPAPTESTTEPSQTRTAALGAAPVDWESFARLRPIASREPVRGADALRRRPASMEPRTAQSPTPTAEEIVLRVDSAKDVRATRTASPRSAKPASAPPFLRPVPMGQQTARRQTSIVAGPVRHARSAVAAFRTPTATRATAHPRGARRFRPARMRSRTGQRPTSIVAVARAGRAPLESPAHSMRTAPAHAARAAPVFRRHRRALTSRRMETSPTSTAAAPVPSAPSGAPARRAATA